MDDLSKIENEMMNELREVGNEETKSIGPVTSNIPDPDFISDSTMLIVLRYKNKLIVSHFTKELGEAETKAIGDLYQVTDEERKLYKRLLQNFIREHMPDYVEKISKITDSDLAAVFILEWARANEAKVLRKMSLAKKAKDESK